MKLIKISEYTSSFSSDEYFSIRENKPSLAKQEAGRYAWSLKIEETKQEYDEETLNKVLVISIFKKNITNSLEMMIQEILLRDTYQLDRYNHLYFIEIDINRSELNLIGGISIDSFHKRKKTIMNSTNNIITGYAIHKSDCNPRMLVNMQFDNQKKEIVKKEDRENKRRDHLFSQVDQLTHSQLPCILKNFYEGFEKNKDNTPNKLFLFGRRKIHTLLDDIQSKTNITWKDIGILCSLRYNLNDRFFSATTNNGTKDIDYLDYLIEGLYKSDFALSVGIFQGDNESSILKERSESHMILLEYISLRVLSILYIYIQSTYIKQKFIEGEKKLFRRQLELYCFTECNVLQFMAQNDLIKPIDSKEEKEYPFTLQLCLESKIREISEELYRSQFKGPLPCFWYTCNFTLALDSQSQFIPYIKNGIAYVCYKQLKQYILPSIQEKSLYRFLFQHEKDEDIIKEYKDTIQSLFKYDSLSISDKGKMILPKELNDFLDPIFMDSRNNISSKRIEGKNVVLPDIEDIVSNKHAPLCILRIEKKLNTNHHMEFQERQQYSGYLLDNGYSLQDSTIHLKKRYTIGKSIQQDISSCLNTGRIDNKAKARKHHFSLSCNKMIESVETKESCSNCPYSTMKQDSLIELLKSVNIKDKEEIDFILSNRSSNPKSACSNHFKVVHKIPFPSYHPLNLYVPASWSLHSIIKDN